MYVLYQRVVSKKVQSHKENDEVYVKALLARLVTVFNLRTLSKLCM